MSLSLFVFLVHGFLSLSYPCVSPVRVCRVLCVYLLCLFPLRLTFVFLFVSPLPVSLFLLNLSCLLIPILVSVRVFVLLPVLFCYPCLMCIVSSFASPVMLCLICPSGVLMHLHFPCMSPHVYILCLFPFVPCKIFCLSPSFMLSLC